MCRSAERQKRATVCRAMVASDAGSKMVVASRPNGWVMERAWAFCRAVRRGPLSRSAIGAPNCR
jgi:hypothetical protein